MGHLALLLPSLQPLLLTPGSQISGGRGPVVLLAAGQGREYGGGRTASMVSLILSFFCRYSNPEVWDPSTNLPLKAAPRRQPAQWLPAPANLVRVSGPSGACGRRVRPAAARAHPSVSEPAPLHSVRDPKGSRGSASSGWEISLFWFSKDEFRPALWRRSCHR